VIYVLIIIRKKHIIFYHENLFTILEVN